MLKKTEDTKNEKLSNLIFQKPTSYVNKIKYLRQWTSIYLCNRKITVTLYNNIATNGVNRCIRGRNAFEFLTGDGFLLNC